MSIEGPTGPITLEPKGVLANVTGVIFVVPFVVLAALIFAGWAVAVVIVAVALAGLFLFAFDDIQSSLSWQPARLEVPHAAFELGSAPVVKYLRDSKRARDVGSCRVDCTLECRESVRYRQGTDTKTERTTVFTKTFTASGRGTAKGIEAEIEIGIPADRGAPSFDLPNNEVEWFLKTEVHGERLPKDDQRFTVQVVPVLQAVGRSRVQDT